jgi:hypothetical protein
MGRIQQPMHNLHTPNGSRRPLTPLQLPMAEPMMHNPSLMLTRIGLLNSKTCMTIAAAKLPGLMITSLISPHPTLTGCYCFSICHNHDWLPPVLPLCHCTYAPACHQIPLVLPKCSDDGEESGALNSPEHFFQEPHYIHDKMIDASLCRSSR